MKFFDTHAHLTDARFDEDREALIKGLPAKDIGLVVNVACDLTEAEATRTLTEQYDFIYGAVGIHPHIAQAMQPHDLEGIRGYLALPKFVALGEIGLDYHYDFSPREAQRACFAAQLELAQALDLPVILHVREAFFDCMDILRAHRQKLKGVMHCYSGSLETAFQCMDMNLYIALGGAVTFKNAVKQAEIARRLPLERLLLETDCPYMTPVPHRGQRNDPGYIRMVAEKTAAERGMELAALAQVTYENGKRLFGIG